MKMNNLIKEIERKGAILAKNNRPIKSIVSKPEFVPLNLTTGSYKREYFELLGYIFDRPVMKKFKLGRRKK